MAAYTNFPSGIKVQPQPFKAHVAEEKLQHFKDLLKLSPIAPANFENTNCGRKYGTRRDWLANAKKSWETEFDWRKWEDRINSYPNYTMPVEYKGVTIDIHFLALFSEKPDAIPLAFYHGWPGSFLEFLQILDIIKKKYSPQDLPYHIIVPSLPGFAYSGPPPLDQDYDTPTAAFHLDQLMQNLGFGSGYIAQGGDIGSAVSRYQAAFCDSCKGMHLNMCSVPPPENADELPITGSEKIAMENAKKFKESGMSYFYEHGHRTATIGLTLSASPIAMLSWIGEKFLEWTDEDPPLDEILASVTLYWMTDCYPTSIYNYRALGKRQSPPVSKPSGYSMFPYDLVATPQSWLSSKINIVSYSQHERGGHFAAMEKPNELLADVEEYIKKAWKGSRL